MTYFNFTAYLTPSRGYYYPTAVFQFQLLCVQGIDFSLFPIPHTVDALGIGGGNIVMVKNAPSGKEEGVFFIRHFTWWYMIRGLENSQTPGKLAGMQEGGTRVICAGAGPVQTNLIYALIVDTSHRRRQGCHFIPDLPGMVVLHGIAQAG